MRALCQTMLLAPDCEAFALKHSAVLSTRRFAGPLLRGAVRDAADGVRTGSFAQAYDLSLVVWTASQRPAPGVL